MTDTGPEPESSEDSEGLEDEARRKFREALERKRVREAGTTGRLTGNKSGKVHGAHGPASSRRSFRRRGGG